jgi:hypothetical protein
MTEKIQLRMFTAVLIGALALISVGILWYVGHRSSVRVTRLQFTRLGFSLEVPNSWFGYVSAREDEAGRVVEFLAQPKAERPELMFKVEFVDKANWESIVAESGQSVRELGRTASDVVYASWSTNNPYQGITGRQYFRAMQLVPFALDSFRLDGSVSPQKQSTAVTCNTMPTFDEYMAEPAYAGEVANLDFTSFSGAREFRTVLNQAQQLGPNFAGRFVVASWGCGTSCQEHAVTDVASGRIVAFGLASQFGAEYRLDSRLLILNPPERMAESRFPIVAAGEISYYELTDTGQLIQICRLPAPGMPVTRSDGTVCIQVITPAQNPRTGEERDFPTPCDVPLGWQIVPPKSM